MAALESMLTSRTRDRRARREDQRTRKDYAPPLGDPVGRSRKRAVAYTFGFLAALGVFVALVASDANTVEQPANGLATATIDDITDNPELYDGRNVTVVGEAPESEAGQAAFTLSDGDALLSDEILVINDGERPMEADGQRWRATGRLEIYDGKRLGSGETVVGGGVEKGDPVLIAQKVAPVPPPTVGW